VPLVELDDPPIAAVANPISSRCVVEELKGDEAQDLWEVATIIRL